LGPTYKGREGMKKGGNEERERGEGRARKGEPGKLRPIFKYKI